MNNSVTDYHDFTYPAMPKEQRNKLNVGDIYINGAICKLCGYFIRSRNGHDMVSCKCGEIFVDGGSYYARAGFKNKENYKPIIVYFDDVEVKE